MVNIFDLIYDISKTPHLAALLKNEKKKDISNCIAFIIKKEMLLVFNCGIPTIKADLTLSTYGSHFN